MKRYQKDVIQALNESTFDVRIIESVQFKILRNLHNFTKFLYYFENWICMSIKIAFQSRSNDILYFTDTSDAGVMSFLMRFILRLRGILVITTTHDLYGVFAANNQIPNVKLKKSGKLLQFIILRGLKNSNLNIAISNESARHSLQLLPLVRTEIVHLPIRFEFETEVPILMYLPDYFATLVMQSDWRKDRLSSIQCWARIHDIHPSLYLVIVGSPLSDKERNLINGIENFVVRLEKLTEQELSCVYSQSAFNIFLSKYEGFGYPILEANYYAKPTILFDTPHFREIGGPDNFYIRDLSTSKLSSYFEKINDLENPALALRVATFFSFESFASKLVTLLNRLVDHESA
jgi:glycosyltransferase involved in cell wall biosynthesis